MSTCTYGKEVPRIYIRKGFKTDRKQQNLPDRGVAGVRLGFRLPLLLWRTTTEEAAGGDGGRGVKLGYLHLPVVRRHTQRFGVRRGRRIITGGFQ